MPNPTIKRMLENELEELGFDGLYNADGECACIIGNLMPCEEPGIDCAAGYKVDGCTGACGLGCKFHILPTKEG